MFFKSSVLNKLQKTTSKFDEAVRSVRRSLALSSLPNPKLMDDIDTMLESINNEDSIWMTTKRVFAAEF